MVVANNMVWSRGLIACGRVGLAGMLATQEDFGQC